MTWQIASAHCRSMRSRRQLANTPARLTASRWQTHSCDGHGAKALYAAIAVAKAESGKPSLFAMKTAIWLAPPKKWRALHMRRTLTKQRLQKRLWGERQHRSRYRRRRLRHGGRLDREAFQRAKAGTPGGPCLPTRKPSHCAKPAKWRLRPPCRGWLTLRPTSRGRTSDVRQP